MHSALVRSIYTLMHSAPYDLFHPLYLYTSIPNMAGLEAVRHFLSTADGLNLPVEFLIECLHFVLDNNFFAFEGKKYSQI